MKFESNSFKTIWCRYLMLAIALAFLISGCGSDDPTGPVNQAPVADYYVNAGTGNDINAGTAAAPFKTITQALSVAVAGDTIQVAPGDYDVANGEVFPLVMPDSVALVGDIANQGTGTDTTLIKGSGTANPSYTACLVGADGARVAGFFFSASSSIIRDFGVFSDGVDFTVASCTFQGMYGGVRLQGLGTPVVTGCIFQTISYGIYNFCNGFSTTSANTFVTASLSVDINTTGDALVSGNTFAADGILGIQIQRGAPVITGNTFEGDHNAIYGAIRVSINGGGTARNNTFDCATSPCVRIGSSRTV